VSLGSRGVKKGLSGDDKKDKGMERIEAKKEDWVFLATDDDGTQAYMDMAGLSAELDEAALYKVWLKHVPPPGSKTFGEIQRLLTKSKRGAGAPHHVKQALEIDCFKGMSRNLSLVVCDKKGQVLHVVHHRFPEWVEITGGSLLCGVRKNIDAQVKEARPQEVKPLSFTHSRASSGTAGKEAPTSAGPDDSNGNGTEGQAQTSQAAPFTGKLRLLPHEEVL
jgi:hypothetical protein